MQILGGSDTAGSEGGWFVVHPCHASLPWTSVCKDRPCLFCFWLTSLFRCLYCSPLFAACSRLCSHSPRLNCVATGRKGRAPLEVRWPCCPSAGLYRVVSCSGNLVPESAPLRIWRPPVRFFDFRFQFLAIAASRVESISSVSGGRDFDLVRSGGLSAFLSFMWFTEYRPRSNPPVVISRTSSPRESVWHVLDFVHKLRRASFFVCILM